MIDDSFEGEKKAFFHLIFENFKGHFDEIYTRSEENAVCTGKGPYVEFVPERRRAQRS